MTKESGPFDYEPYTPWGSPEVVELFEAYGERHREVRSEEVWEGNLQFLIRIIDDNPDLRYQVANELLDHQDEPLAVVKSYPVFGEYRGEVIGREFGLAKVDPHTGAVHYDTYDWAITEVGERVRAVNPTYAPDHIRLILEQREAQRRLGLDPEL